MADIAQLEVAWYIRHGRYFSRLYVDGKGYPYVIGDWSWSRNYPGKPEIIEPLMREAVERSREVEESTP